MSLQLAGADAGALDPADIEPVPDATEEDPEPAGEEAKGDDGNEATGGGRLRSSGDSGGCNVSPPNNEAGSMTIFALALTIAFAAVTRAALRRRS